MDVVLQLGGFALIAATAFVSGLNQPPTFRAWTRRVVLIQLGLAVILLATWVFVGSIAYDPLIASFLLVTVVGAAELGRRKRRSRNASQRPD